MSEPSLDWGTAEVRDGDLSVQLVGDPPVTQRFRLFADGL
jgi:hypothetical protein